MYFKVFLNIVTLFNDIFIKPLTIIFIFFSTVSRQISVIGDPHFIVPLWSDKMLCYSIQGYPDLAFNLIHSSYLIINAQYCEHYW